MTPVTSGMVALLVKSSRSLRAERTEERTRTKIRAKFRMAQASEVTTNLLIDSASPRRVRPNQRGPSTSGSNKTEKRHSCKYRKTIRNKDDKKIPPLKSHITLGVIWFINFTHALPLSRHLRDHSTIKTEENRNLQ